MGLLARILPAGLLVFAIVAASTGLLAGCSTGEPETGSPATEVPQAVVEVKGMACRACAARLESSLSAMDGVDAATVSVAEGQARVRLAPNHSLTGEDLREKVETTGYRPVHVRFAAAANR